MCVCYHMRAGLWQSVYSQPAVLSKNSIQTPHPSLSARCSFGQVSYHKHIQPEGKNLDLTEIKGSFTT